MADTFKKPSFFGSVMSGIGGFVKGMLSGGVVGALLGGGIGAVVALVTQNYALAGAFALEGASIGGTLMGAVGSVAGIVTGVVRHREAGQPSAQDVVNVAKITFAQGVGVGQQLGHAQAHEEHSSRWRDHIRQQRGQQVLPTNQVQ